MPKRLWRGFSAAVDRTSRWSALFAGLLIIPLTLMVAYTALMRTLTPWAPDWSFLITVFLYGVAIMLASAEVLRREEHVAVDILPRVVPLKVGQLLNMFSTLVIIAVAVTFIYIGSEMAIYSTSINEHSPHQSSFNPPIWWFRWVIPVASFLLLLEAIRRLIGEILSFGKAPAAHVD